MKHGSIAVFALGCMVIIAAMFGRYEIQVQGPGMGASGSAYGANHVIYRIDRWEGTVESCHPFLVGHELELETEAEPSENPEQYLAEMKRNISFVQPDWCKTKMPG